MREVLGGLPLLVPGVAVAATLAARSPRAVFRVACACTAGLWLMGLLLLFRAPATWDALARWYDLLVLVLGGLSLAVSVQYVGVELAHGVVDAAAVRRYFALFETLTLSLLAVGCFTNYLIIWAAVEGTTLSTVMLVAFDGGPRPVEAAWKFIVVTGIGGLIALMGTVLLLHGSGVPLNSWSLMPAAAVRAPAGARVAVLLGLVLAVVGYGSKAGLVPFHTWLPDAHSEAPAPVSALLSGVKLVGGLYALLRLAALASVAVGPVWPHTLLIMTGLLSLGIAAAAVPGQKDLKRMFAYSSIEHMGVIALGAGFGGVGLLGALLHMWTHGFSKTALFYGSGNVRLRYAATGAPRVRGVLATMPITGSALTLAAVAIVGLPPFGLFWSEWLVLLGGVQAGQVLWVTVALVFLVVNFVGFGLRLPDLLLGSAPEGGVVTAGESAVASWPLGVALVGALVAGLVLPAVFHAAWLGAAATLTGGGPR